VRSEGIVKRMAKQTQPNVQTNETETNGSIRVDPKALQALFDGAVEKQKVSNTEGALEDFSRLYSLALDTANRHWQGVACCYIGHTSTCLRKFANAYCHYVKDLEIKLERYDKAGEGIAYGNVAHSLDSLYNLYTGAISKKKRCEYLDSLADFTQFLRFAEENGNKKWIGAANQRIGAIYRLLRRKEEAKPFVETDIAIREELDIKGYVNPENELQAEAALYHSKHEHMKNELGTRFLQFKMILWGPVVPCLLSSFSRRSERKIQSSVALKNAIRAARDNAGIDFTPNVSSNEQQHIDDRLLDIMRNALETPRVAEGDTPLSNAHECLLWFFSLAPPKQKPRPNPWDLLSLNDFILPDVSIKPVSAVELVKKINGEDGDEQAKKEMAKHRGSPKKQVFPLMPKFPKQYTLSEKEMQASTTVGILQEIRLLVKRREQHIKLMEEAVELDWWRAISVEWKAVVRDVTVALIEKIIEWKKRFQEPDRVFKWKKMNYLLKIPSDLDFLRKRWSYCNAQGRNPFMLPFGIDEADSVEDVIVFKNKKGKCRVTACIQVLKNEERLYGRYKWNAVDKKLYAVPGFLFNPPPKSFMTKTASTLLPSRASIGSTRSFRTRASSGIIETVYSIPKGKMLELSRASSRSSARLKNIRVSEMSESPRNWSPDRAVPKTPEQVFREKKSRESTREHFSRRSRRFVQEVDSRPHSKTSNYLQALHTTETGEKYDHGLWKDVIGGLPPRTPPVSAGLQINRPFTPLSVSTPPSLQGKDTPPPSSASSVHLRPQHTSTANGRTNTPPMSASSQYTFSRPFTPTGTPPASSGNRIPFMDSSPWLQGGFVLDDGGFENFDTKGNEEPMTRRTGALNSNIVKMCPLPNCSVCSSIKLEEKLERQNIRWLTRTASVVIQSSSSQRTHSQSIYMAMLSKTVMRENNRLATVIQKRWRGILVRSLGLLRPCDRVTSNTGAYINFWFPNAHKCALQIQMAFRNKSAKWELKFRKLVKIWNTAAVTVQCFARLFITTQFRVAREKKRHWLWSKSSIAIQCMARSLFARRRVRVRRAELNYQRRLLEAAKAIQRIWRSFKAYRLVMLMRRHSRAKHIQKYYRGHLVREQLLHIFRMTALEKKHLQTTLEIVERAELILKLTSEKSGTLLPWQKFHLKNRMFPWQQEEFYEQAREKSKSMQMMILKHLFSSKFTGDPFRSKIARADAEYLSVYIDWEQCQFFIPKCHEVKDILNKRLQYITQWKLAASASLRAKRLIELVKRIRWRIPNHLSQECLKCSTYESSIRYWQTREDRISCLLDGTIDSFRADGSKTFMKRCIQNFCVSVVATQMIALQTFPTAIRNAVNVRLENNHLHDLDVWSVERGPFGAEDVRSERYRKYLTAGKYARLMVHETFEEFKDKKLTKSQIHDYEVQELTRRLGHALDEENVEEVIRIVDPTSSGIVKYEQYCVWWFSGNRVPPTGAKRVKLNSQLKIKYFKDTRKRAMLKCYHSIGPIKRKRAKREKDIRDAEFKIKNEERMKKMAAERAERIQKEEDERKEKEEYDALMEKCDAKNKELDLAWAQEYVGGVMYENKWRPPANALRISRLLGVTASSKKAMQKVSKTLSKRNKTPKKMSEKEKKKLEKKAAKEAAKVKEAEDKKAARKAKMAAKRRGVKR
jgi:hypothetical protein